VRATLLGGEIFGRKIGYGGEGQIIAGNSIVSGQFDFRDDWEEGGFIIGELLWRRGGAINGKRSGKWEKGGGAWGMA